MFTHFGVQASALGPGLPVHFKQHAFAELHQAIKAEIAGFLSKAQLMCKTRPAAPGTSFVVHHYNNSGIANVMGPDGVASGNTNNVQITQQTLNLEDPRIAGELAEIRKALAAETDDDDAAIEAGTVASAQKALKAGDLGGFRAAMKRLGAKTWGVAEKLALAWMTTEGRNLLDLPPG